MAERVGFEPTVRFPVRSLSRRVLSTTQSPLRSGRDIILAESMHVGYADAKSKKRLNKKAAWEEVKEAKEVKDVKEEETKRSSCA